MPRARVVAALTATAVIAAAAVDTAGRKINLIQHDAFPRGSVVTIGKEELNTYVRNQVAASFRQGIRAVRLDLGYGRGSGSAYIDFPRLRQSMGKPLGWFMSMLLAGERRVQVDARIRSSGGKAQVDLERVQVSGISISGSTLDYLVRNFVLPYYPNATLGRPFALAHHVERLEVRPAEVHVVIAH